MDGVGGYAGWRWIFILEGLLTIIVALFAPFAIHDSPETATFLTEQERRFVIHALRIQNSADEREMVQDEAEFRMKYVIDAFTDWQIYLGLFSRLLHRRAAWLVLTRSKCTGASPVRFTGFPYSFLPLLKIWDTSHLPPNCLP